KIDGVKWTCVRLGPQESVSGLRKNSDCALFRIRREHWIVLEMNVADLRTVYELLAEFGDCGKSLSGAVYTNNAILVAQLDVTVSEIGFFERCGHVLTQNGFRGAANRRRLLLFRPVGAWANHNAGFVTQGCTLG